MSGWQDSNLRPSGPKPDALTGLRYTPKIRQRKSIISFLNFINYQALFEIISDNKTKPLIFNTLCKI